MAVISSATGQPLSQDPAVTLQLFLKNNWGLLELPAATVIFDTKHRNLGPLNGVFVKRRDSSMTYNHIGPARQAQEEVFDISLYARGTSAEMADDRAWLMKERVRSLINANPDYHKSNGIEWVWNESWTYLPPSATVEQILSGQRGTPRVAVYVGRVKVSYDKTYVPAPDPVVNTPPAVRSLVLARLGTTWTENPAKSLRDYITTNWSIAPITELANYKQGSAAPSLFTVRPSNEVSEVETAAQPSRDRTTQTLFVDLYSLGPKALDKDWKAREEVQRIIQSDITGLWSKGIEEMRMAAIMTHDGESEADLEQGKASTSSYRIWSSIKVELAYTLEAS